MRVIFSLLFATTLVVGAAIPSAEEYRVNGLEKYGASDEMYSGHMPLAWENNKQGSLFFWLAKHRPSENPELAAGADKLVIWLNGGPGCSSMIGMMHENGPFSIAFADEPASTSEPSVEPALKYKLKNNAFSWNRVANVLYVEQPLRTGFAAAAEGAAPTTEEADLASDFRQFLLSFLEVFPQYKGAELYISGESYAGFYIPWIASHIVRAQLVPDSRGNLVRDVGVDNINLSGVAIGNGVMDMFFQEQSYAEYAYYHGLIPLGAKLRFDREWAACMESIEQSGEILSRASFDRCDMMNKVLTAAGLPNEFNTATFIQYDGIIGPASPFMTFMQDPAVQEMIHVRGYDLPGVNFKMEGAGAGTKRDERGRVYSEPPVSWGPCSQAVEDSMTFDHPVTVVPQLQFLTQKAPSTTTTPPATVTTASSTTAAAGGAGTGAAGTKLRGSPTTTTHTTTTTSTPTTTTTTATTNTDPLSHAIRVLLYSGEFDLNTNTLGTLHTLEANRWRGKSWSKAERSLWKVKHDVAGEYFTMDDVFSFLIVRNSGHLMPMDLPAISLNLISRFVNGRSFADQVLPSEQSYIDEHDDGEEPVLYSANSNTNTSTIAAAGGNVMMVLVAAVLMGAMYLLGKHSNSKEGAKLSLTSVFSGFNFNGTAQDRHSYVEIPSVDTDTASSDSSGADSTGVGSVGSVVVGKSVGTRFP